MIGTLLAAAVVSTDGALAPASASSTAALAAQASALIGLVRAVVMALIAALASGGSAYAIVHTLKGVLKVEAKTIHRVTAIVLAGFGAFVGGAPGALAMGLGAAVAAPLHDIIDALRARKLPKEKSE